MEYKHFGHQHNLRIYQLQPGDHEYRCSGCDSFCSGSAYGCLGCKFFLHEQCGNAGRSLQHPSHPFHHLTLVAYTTHSAGTFACNACFDTGNAFSYCCPLCDFDLHVPCAFLPQIKKHESYFHSLSITYSLPFPNVSSRFCDICHKLLDCRYWSYNCSACNFAAHALCAAKQMRPETCHGENVSGSGTTAPQSDNIHLKEAAASGTPQDQPEPAETQDPTLKAMCELERLKLQMQMTNELAKMMASFNLSSLI